jgi:DNA-binding transcriptional LysR family regulator
VFNYRRTRWTAAARLGISASMVSQHVKELEERLGARLLNRTTRKVSLTETGRAYYERCTRLLAAGRSNPQQSI